MSITDASLVEALETLSLSSKVTTYEHQAAFTVQEQSEIVGKFPGTLTKNLFLRDKKHGLFLVTTKADREVNLKVVGNLLNLSGANLRFGDEELLQEKLKVIKGSVSPFAVLNDTACEVKFCIDKELMDTEIINIHPLRNDRTTSISPADLLQFLTHAKHEPTFLDFNVAASTPPPPPKKSGGGKSGPAKAPSTSKGTDGKKETGLGLSCTKEENFADWYTEVITKSEMIDYGDIAGCYILRPWAFFIWEQIQDYINEHIKKLGVKNTYFPLFVTERALQTEKDHVEGFAAEVAWVTKSGKNDLAEPIAIRPTSETIMYPFFAKWIRSHRDLPLEINQWSNVVRWEFKDATPFLRSREFLWQEGHTAHATYEECEERVMSILDLYRSVYEDLLCVPVVKGKKTEEEKFPGGLSTTTVEAFIHGSGRAIQGATSHNLGQSFGKMFNIRYENDVGENNIPWQSSWGLTTRTIGVAVMVHGDNKGLVLPPKIAPTQAIIIPIVVKSAEETATLVKYAEDLKATLKKVGVRADIDSRSNYSPGWKYNHWEQKGVPLRIEVGPRDIANAQCRVVRRMDGDKQDFKIDGIGTKILEVLDDIQATMFRVAKEKRDAKIVQVTKWDDFVPALEMGNMVLTPFCDQSEWEIKVKKMSRDEALRGEFEADTCAVTVAAKTLCKPFEQPPLPEGTPCFVSGLPATTWVLWGRSY